MFYINRDEDDENRIVRIYSTKYATHHQHHAACINAIEIYDNISL